MSWSQYADHMNEPTAESRQRGFGPFGSVTEALRRSGNLWWQDRDRFNAWIADLLLA
jgi:hypothetical protein